MEGIWSVIWLVPLAAFVVIAAISIKKNDPAKKAEEMLDKSARDCTIEERTAILNQAILEYVNLGWRVVSQTPTTAQLVRDKRANGCVAVILFLLLIVPFILYLVLYKGTESCYLEVNIKGRVIYHYRK